MKAGLTGTLLLSAAALALQPAGASTTGAAAAAAAQQFGKCAVRNYEGAELLATAPGSEEVAAVIAEFQSRGCNAPSGDIGLLRGAVAEQLFQSDFGTVNARSSRHEVEIFSALAPEEFHALADAPRRRVDLLAVGTCVALAQPKKAANLLDTDHAGADEARIIAELSPALSSCVSQGQKYDFSKAELRGLLAEGVYRTALTQTMDPDSIVVTAQSGGITCRTGFVTGKRLMEKECMTEAQWQERRRERVRQIEIVQRMAERYDRANKEVDGFAW